VRRSSTARRAVEQVGALPEGGVRRRTRRDVLASEEPLEIRVARGVGGAGVPIAVTMRTPGSDFDLAAGFLLAEGMIDRAADVLAMRYCIDGADDGAQRYNIVNVDVGPEAPFDPAAPARGFYVSSSCGICGKASIEAVQALGRDAVRSALRVDPGVLFSLPERLLSSQTVFRRTGGLHAAGLFACDGELLRAREDVGRHNAMDKLIGAALLAGELPLSDRIVLASGRLSFELVQKASRAGVAVLAGVSAPSSLAVELAEEVGMTLVGFLRDGRFNVYAGGERLDG
jgi:FdhD protein